MNKKGNQRIAAGGRRASVRITVFFLLLLLFASVFASGRLTAAAEGETTTFTNDVTGIRVDALTASLPENATLFVTVGRPIQFEQNSGGVADYLDKNLYWQPISLDIKGGETSYSGAATAYIPIGGAVNSVKQVLLPVDPTLPECGLTDTSFSVEGNILTVQLQLPAFVYIGTTDPSVFIPVPGDFVDQYNPSIGEQIAGALEDFRDGILDKGNELLENFLYGERDAFNEFLQSNWTSTYELHIQDVVNIIYKIVYPFGVFVALIAWSFSVAAAGFTLNLDPTNRNSIIRAIFQLVIGLALLTATPQLLMAIFSICNSIKTAIVGQIEAVGGHSFIQTIFSLKILLSMALIGVMQCVSPLFIGTAAGNEGTRRFAVSFLKEYGLRCMEMVLVTIYILIIDRLEDIVNMSSPLYDLVISIVLSISVFSIDKKFERMFH